MKRLVFCFDGTWNRVDAPNPTNVVLIAQSIAPVGKGGIAQVIHYDEGVGTQEGEKWRGGLFGEGLLRNMVEAYKFLIFNYDVGDEIYVFGFSRGAFTARSFVSLVRYAGIPRRKDAARITQAVRLYQDRPRDNTQSDDLRKFRWECSPDLCIDPDEDAWRVKSCPGYKAGQSPILRIRYLGVWDTVGSLGVPNSLLMARWVNRKFEFHNQGLTSMVASARHAVAIDEKRNSFSPTLWDNLDPLNASLGFRSDDPHAPYQQKWFPGTHGSVGGGGDDRRLSDEALDWVLSGARAMGLQLDTHDYSVVHTLSPDYRAPIGNMRSKPKFSLNSYAMSHLPGRDRHPGPQHLWEVSSSAQQRWCMPAAELPDGQLYRPPTLSAAAAELDKCSINTPAAAAPAAPALPPNSVQAGHYTVQRGDTLRGLAHQLYGDAERAGEIFDANRAILTDPDRIYPGQRLWLP